MQRPLIPFVISYIYGIIAAEMFRYLPVTVTVVSIPVFVAGVYLSKANLAITVGRNKALLWIIIIAAPTGFFYMLYDSRVPSNDISRYATGEKMTVTGIVDEPPMISSISSRKTVAHISAMEIIRGEDRSQVSGRVRLSVYDPEAVLSYGDIVRFTGRLKEVRGFKNPGLFDYAGYIGREGIRARVGIGKKKNISKIGKGGNRLLREIYDWREEIRLSIIRGLSGPSSAILQAMVIGATGDLTHEIRDRFTAAGIIHILSISGSHLGFVTLLSFITVRYALIYLPCRLLLKLSLHAIPSKTAAFITILPVTLYSALAGGEVATVRSLIMALVYLAAILMEREDDAMNTLIVAALLVLLWDPQALFDISFQLSYMAVFSMILITKRFYNRGAEITGRWRRYSERLKHLMLLTLGASLSTAPIVACYYNQITWVGLISNMIIVPFVGFAVLPLGLFTCFLGLISHTGVIPLAWLNDLLLNLLYRIVDFFAQFPLSVIYIPSPEFPFILLLYLFFISLLFLKDRWARLLLPLVIFSVVSYLAFNILYKDKGEMMRVTFLDVGQGDSALLEFPDGKVMVIDGGGTFGESFDTGRSIIAPYLWNAGISKIDYVVSSHPQLDHVKGLAYLADKFSVGEVWTNGRRTAASRNFDTAVRGRGIRELVVYRGTGDVMVGGCSIQFLNPSLNALNALNALMTGNRENDLSIVMRVSCNDVTFLFTGDIEAEAMREIAGVNGSLAGKVIKVPHHGAKGSVEYSFIASVKPAIAVISAGYQNSYAHPSPETIFAYERNGAALYRTDLDGAIIIEAGDDRLKIKTYGDMVLRDAAFDNPRSLITVELSNLKKILRGGI